MPSGTIKEYQGKIEFYELVLDNVRNGVMITYPDGKIIFFSAAHGNFIGIDPKSTIGKNCAEVVENTRIPEINHPHRIMGQDMVVVQRCIILNMLY